MSEQFKNCNECKTDRPLTDFTKSKRNKLGVSAQCKDCAKNRLINKDQKIKDLDGELWKDIKEWEGLYQVSNLGRLKALKRSVLCGCYKKIRRERLLSCSLGSTGYPHATLYGNNNLKNVLIHRLVAFAFVPNPNNKSWVNHKNLDKTDCRAINLEWCTENENHLHAYDRGVLPNLMLARPVYQYTKNGIFLKEFPSCNEAARHLGEINAGTISGCANGRYETGFGFVWSYEKIWVNKKKRDNKNNTSQLELFEEWRDIANTDGLYQVSNMGRVKSKSRLATNGTGGKFYTKEKFLKGWLDKGYASTRLRFGKRWVCVGVHRLVALAFIPNPENKPCVHHKDHNRKNNNVNNLEWVTIGENIRYYFKHRTTEFIKQRLKAS